jgi:hypothetical protein
VGRRRHDPRAAEFERLPDLSPARTATAAGAYGCVVIDTRNVCDRSVLKVFPHDAMDASGPNGKEDRDREVANYEEFARELTPAVFAEAFVPLVDTAEFSLADIGPRGADRCRDMNWDTSLPIAGAVYEYGGISLQALGKMKDKSLASVGAYVALMNLGPVLTALLQLHAHGLMHNDIHTGNVVFDPQTQRVRFIDLGLAHKFTRFSEEGPMLAPHYPLDYAFLWDTWLQRRDVERGAPPVSRVGDILDVIWAGHAAHHNSLVVSAMAILRSKGAVDDVVYPWAQRALLPDMKRDPAGFAAAMQTLRDGYGEWVTAMRDAGASQEAVQAAQKSAIDVFGMGRVMLALWVRCRSGPMPEADGASPRAHFSPEALAPRHGRLWYLNVVLLAVRMMQPDVRHRPTAEAVLGFYRDFMKDMADARAEPQKLLGSDGRPCEGKPRAVWRDGGGGARGGGTAGAGAGTGAGSS